MSVVNGRKLAAELRQRALALYRRADYMPLRHGDDSIDRHVALKDEADKLMARAELLDPRDH
jgi:hypothetical protein